MSLANVPSKFALTLFNWVHANKNELNISELPKRSLSMNVAKYQDLKDRLLKFERNLRTTDELLAGKYSAPMGFHAGNRRDSRALVLFILDMPGVLQGPLWESFFLMDGFEQFEFEPMAVQFVDYNRLPQELAVFAGAQGHFSAEQELELITTAGIAEREIRKTFPMPVVEGRPLKFQLQQLQEYAFQITKHARAVLNDPSNWPLHPDTPEVSAEMLALAKRFASQLSDEERRLFAEQSQDFHRALKLILEQ